MRFFLLISLFTALMLGVTVQTGRSMAMPAKRSIPAAFIRYMQKIKKSFEKPETANVLLSFFTGNKNGISPYTKTAFKKVNLSFLLSPSGIHLSAFFLFITFFIKRIKRKWLKHLSKVTLLASIFFLPGLESIKRLSLLRLLFQAKFLTKAKLSLELLFFILFFISFLCGHYTSSPLGFIFSFAFMGTFFSLQRESKIKLILGLFSTQLILALFLGNKVSLLSIPIGLLGSFIFSFLFSFCIIFVGTFWLTNYNWIEPILRAFIVSVQWCAKFLNGTFTSSSLFLILAVWLLMSKKATLPRSALLALCLFLHTNTTMTPVIFNHNNQVNMR